MHGGACGSRTGSRTPTATGRDRPRGSTSARSTIPRGSALRGSSSSVMTNPTRSTSPRTSRTSTIRWLRSPYSPPTRPPVLDLELPDVVMVEGERRVGVFDLDDYFTDPDQDALFYSGGYTHLNVTIHANHSVDVEAQSNWFGWEQVTFRAEDPTGAIAEDTIIITVLPIDDPPTIGNVPNLTVRPAVAAPPAL